MTRRDCFIEVEGRSQRAYGYIDKFKRRQSCLILEDLFPTKLGVCACGCNTPLTGRQRRWAGEEHSSGANRVFQVITGNTEYIRWLLFEVEQGYCRHCGVQTQDWEADHIVPVHQGGGGCDITNFQTLCQGCHKKKTKQDSHNSCFSTHTFHVILFFDINLLGENVRFGSLQYEKEIS